MHPVVLDCSAAYPLAVLLCTCCVGVQRAYPLAVLCRLLCWSPAHDHATCGVVVACCVGVQRVAGHSRCCCRLLCCSYSACRPLAVLLYTCCVELQRRHPTRVLFAPVVLESSAFSPTCGVAVHAVVLDCSACRPLAVLLTPVVLKCSAGTPLAVLFSPLCWMQRVQATRGVVVACCVGVTAPIPTRGVACYASAATTHSDQVDPAVCGCEVACRVQRHRLREADRVACCAAGGGVPLVMLSNLIGRGWRSLPLRTVARLVISYRLSDDVVPQPSWCPLPDEPPLPNDHQ
jgi:hypothetical protein